jgi:hypothetical protein
MKEKSLIQVTSGLSNEKDKSFICPIKETPTLMKSVHMKLVKIILVTWTD